MITTLFKKESSDKELRVLSWFMLFENLIVGNRKACLQFKKRRLSGNN
jgi:hypothetical protein